MILAGVSLNAIVGDNGIITNAMSAKQKQGMAALEEFLQEKYVELYEDIKKDDNRVLSLINNSNTSKYFYKPDVGALQYIVDSEGHALYLINKDNLPNEIKDGLVGGDAGNKTYSDYASLNDVYGVTTDLKVYYCSNGIDSLYGLGRDDLDNDNPLREIFPANSPLANLIGEEGKPVTADDVKSVTELVLDSNSKVTSLGDFYNLTSLKELTLDGLQLDSLNGIENCTQLDYVYFKNYSNENITIKDYSALSGVKNLTYLYLFMSCDKQINDLCEGIKNAEFSKLNYLGIFGLVNNNVMIWDTNNRIGDSKNNKLTNITPLSKLSDITKKAVNYLWLNNNNIIDISSLENFSNVKMLQLENNAIKSFNGLQNMKTLEYLFGYNNNLGADETNEVNETSDSLSYLKNFEKIYYIDIINNEGLKNVSYLSGLSSLRYLYLAACKNIQTTEIVKLKSIFKNCINYSFDSKYSLAMTEDSVTKLDISSQTISKNEFEGLTSCTKLKILNMKNTKIINNETTEELSSGDINELFNRIIPNFSELTQLSLYGFSNLTDIRFLKNLSKMERLDLRNTGILTGQKNSSDEYIGLENVNELTKIKQLGVNNSGTDLSKIQKCLNRLTNEENSTTADIFGKWSWGLTCNNTSVWKTLGNCSELEHLYIRTESEGYVDKSLELDLTSCSKLSDIQCWFFKIKSLKIPTNCTFLLQEGCDDMKIVFSENSKLTTLLLRARDMNIRNLEETFKTLNFCKKLENLTIFGYNIPVNVSNIVENNSLDTLTVGNYSWQVWDGQKGLEYLSVLSEITSLKNLVYTGDNNGTTSLDFISDFLNLNTLNVSDTEVSDISGISNLTNLTTINMYNNKFSDISALENMTSCTSLNLSGNKISNVSPLRNMKLLTTLNLENNAIYDFANGQSNLEVLANLNPSKGGSLTKLLLSGNNITDFSKVSNLTWKDGKSGF